jgi:hypothetical protein
MGYQRILRIAGLAVAMLVATLTIAVVKAAFATVLTTNAGIFLFNLNAGGDSGAITPPGNVPVFVMGNTTTTGDVGSSEMTVVNSAGHDNELVWSGLESNGGGPAAGFNPTANTHIIYIDFAHCVDLRVVNGTSFDVHNGCGFAVSGHVTELF